LAETRAEVSIVFVPAAFTKSAVIEAIEAGIGLVVVITEGVLVQDSAEFWALAQSTVDADGNQVTRIICRNCPGFITPGEALVGITPANIIGKGPIGLFSKSNT
jgi:succinyl-CoA synthetase alpha subunit